MLILFGVNSTNSSLSDINALDTVNWKWVQHFSASGYPQQSNNSSPADANGTMPSDNDSTTSNRLGTGAIAGIAVAGVIVVVSRIYKKYYGKPSHWSHLGCRCSASAALQEKQEQEAR